MLLRLVSARKLGTEGKDAGIQEENAAPAEDTCPLLPRAGDGLAEARKILLGEKLAYWEAEAKKVSTEDDVLSFERDRLRVEANNQRLQRLLRELRVATVVADIRKQRAEAIRLKHRTKNDRRYHRRLQARGNGGESAVRTPQPPTEGVASAVAAKNGEVPSKR